MKLKFAKLIQLLVLLVIMYYMVYTDKSYIDEIKRMTYLLSGIIKHYGWTKKRVINALKAIFELGREVFFSLFSSLKRFFGSFILSLYLLLFCLLLPYNRYMT